MDYFCRKSFFMRILCLITLLTIGLMACSEKSHLEKEVMAIHDEVMPKMGDIHLARKGLRKILSATKDSTVQADIISMINDLESADEGMMRWMAEWKVPAKEPEKTNYLNKEKEKITKVKIDMLSSLEKANAYLNSKKE